jgi:hypothetical protein
MRKNSLKQQRINAELETIIEEFGRGMRNADTGYIARRMRCLHDIGPYFTMALQDAWAKYVEFCRLRNNEKAKNARN